MIYFLRHPETGLIKIGKTIDYSMRLSQLIIKYGDLELIGLAPGYTDEEGVLHRRFAKDNIRDVLSGVEWFRMSPDLERYINKYSRLTLPLPFEGLHSGRGRLIGKADINPRFVNKLPELVRAYQVANQYSNGSYPTLQSIARGMGVDSATFRSYLTSKITSIGIPTLQKMCNYFGISSAEIFVIVPDDNPASEPKRWNRKG